MSINRMIVGGVTLLIIVIAGLLYSTKSFGMVEGKLVISANTSDKAPREAFEKLVAGFRSENPGLDVDFQVIEHEAYKTAIRNFLVADEGPDVGFWFAGNRMAGFVEDGLFEDISDVWAQNGLNEGMASTRSSVTFGGRQYGLPYSYYQWGVYYRHDIFREHLITPPETFDELLQACRTLRAAGIAPFTIGTKFLWTTAGWFDYLNMRQNGLDYHIDLMHGKIKYTDEGVYETMFRFGQAVRAGCFIDNHQNYSWQEAQAPLINGEAAMYLIGNFLVPNLPPETKEQLDFFQFPRMHADIAMAEDAPTDLVFIPSNATNKPAAKAFLAYLSRPENLTEINAVLQQLPPHSEAKAADDWFLKKGAKMLSTSATAQFYDRDTTPEMAKVGMQGFQEFMLDPYSLDDILEELEEERERIFGPLP